MKLSDLYWFIGVFLVVYVFYLIFMVFKKKKYNPKKVPAELKLLIKKYNLDMSSINYKSIMNKIGLVSAFDIAFVSAFVFKFVKNQYLAILVGAIMLIPLILITYGFIGNYYVKKGMIRNGNKKN